MKHLSTYIILFLVISLNTGVFATMQIPDKILVEGNQAVLETSWAYPSPLQCYYMQNLIPYPFEWRSTGNYRGHIAHWEIRDGMLWLNTIEVDRKDYQPKHFKVKNKSSKLKKGPVMAVWFSGVIYCKYLNPEDRYEVLKTYFFQVRDGKIIAQDTFKGSFFDLENRDEYPLVRMHDYYMSFHYNRFSKKYEAFKFEGEVFLLNLNQVRHHPIFDYYGNDMNDFPYHWENEEYNGFPNCEWEISNDSVYITSFQLNFGNRLDTTYSHTINIQEEFNSNQSRIHADWMNNVFFLTQKDMIRIGDSEIRQYAFLEIKNGMVKNKRIYQKKENESIDVKEQDRTFKKLFRKYKIQHFSNKMPKNISL